MPDITVFIPQETMRELEAYQREMCCDVIDPDAAAEALTVERVAAAVLAGWGMRREQRRWQEPLSEHEVGS